jgi:hypothetical protein
LQVTDEVGRFHLWWTSPATLVTQLFADSITLEIAQRIVMRLDEARAENAEAIVEAGGVQIFHDWSSATGYDVEARDHLAQSWRTNLKPGDVRAVYVCMPLSPWIRFAVNIVNVSSQFATGIKTRLVDDPEKALAFLGIKPPANQE